jgi:hypothetical protein
VTSKAGKSPIGAENNPSESVPKGNTPCTPVSSTGSTVPMDEPYLLCKYVYRKWGSFTLFCSKDDDVCPLSPCWCSSFSAPMPLKGV